MKQTSQAIALLVASASASAIVAQTGYQNNNAQWISNVADSNVVTRATSRTAAFQQNFFTGWSWGTVAYMTGKLADNNCVVLGTCVTTNTNSSTCMQCLGKLDSVWCSRTYSFVISGLTADKYQAQATGTYAGSMAIASVAATTSGETWTTATAKDQGSCCQSKAQFLLLAGNVGLTGVATGTIWTPTSALSVQAFGATSISGQGITCPAFATALVGASGAGAFATAAFDEANTAYSSWWCSNGLYKNVLASAGAASTSTRTSNITQMFSQSDNNRLELAMVGCPNLAKVCGAASGIGVYDTGVYVLSAATATVVTIPMASTLATSDKCTWVATSFLYAPTFQMSDGTDLKGLANANWNIHHMEYMTTTGSVAFSEANGLPVVSAGGGITTDAEALGYGNYVPKLNMPGNQFATLRTWYGSGLLLTANQFSSTSPTGTQSAQWFSPYQQYAGNTSALSANYKTVNNNQWLGNVSNMPASSMTNIATTAGDVPAGQNYGNNGPSYFDFRVIRYIPVSAAQTVWTAGNDLNTAYGAKVTAYTTAKTTWNAYVAILKKNAKMDAFAAAFSPPKAPTVPPLPNMPWTPAAYSGYLKQTPLQSQTMLGNLVGTSTTPYISASQPTAQQFWASLDAAQSIGGWGSWTAQIITYRNGWGKSFGTIGYSGATGFDAMSQIWSYKQQCSTANTQVVGGACDGTYAGTTTITGPTTTTQNGSNGTSWMFVTVISLWSTGDTAAATPLPLGQWLNKQSLTLTFTGKAWSSSIGAMSTISAPTAPTAADSLTGVAGASALAASSAAVLAIAALY